MSYMQSVAVLNIFVMETIKEILNAFVMFVF